MHNLKVETLLRAANDQRPEWPPPRADQDVRCVASRKRCPCFHDGRCYAEGFGEFFNLILETELTAAEKQICGVFAPAVSIAHSESVWVPNEVTVCQSTARSVNMLALR